MRRAAGGIVIAMVLAGCGGGKFGDSSPASASPAAMSGRWMLAAPNAPSCGLIFAAAPGAREGRVAPEGGCPEKFYLSRRWTIEQDALVIIDDENNPLAQFRFADGHFEGRTGAGTTVTLAPPAPPVAVPR